MSRCWYVAAFCAGLASWIALPVHVGEAASNEEQQKHTQHPSGASGKHAPGPKGGAAPGGAAAQHGFRTGPAAFARPVRGDFRGRGDPALWSAQDRAVWGGGHWHQEMHDGRFGWWWVVLGVWYFYDQPIYPFPDFVSEIVALPPALVPSPGPVVAPLGPPPPQFWYYCDNPPGYYPYIQTCSTSFRAIPVPAQ